MSVAMLVDPATTAARTAARTRAYSSRSCPDSSRCRFLTNSKNFIFIFLLLWISSRAESSLRPSTRDQLHKGQDQFLHQGTCPLVCDLHNVCQRHRTQRLTRDMAQKINKR